MKKIYGVVLAVIGIVGLLGAFYIQGEVKKGEGKISTVEKQMDMGDRLLSLAPQVQKPVEAMGSPIQEKVKEGKNEVAFYTNLAKWMEIGGVIFLVLGVGVVFLGKKAR